MSAIKHRQEYIPPIHNYVPQHPDWRPIETPPQKKNMSQDNESKICQEPVNPSENDTINNVPTM